MNKLPIPVKINASSRFSSIGRMTIRFACGPRSLGCSRFSAAAIVTLCGRCRSALICPASLTSCLPPSSQVFPVEPQGSRLANRRQTRHVRSGASRNSTHRRMVSLSSSIAAHPARPAPSLAFGAEARVAPYGCHAVNGGPQIAQARGFHG